MAKGKSKIKIPQAHSYDFFVNVVESMADGISELDALAEKFAVKPRTISYYTNLGRWVGLMDGDFINDAGTEFAKLSAKEKASYFRERMLEHKWVKAAAESPKESFDAFSSQIEKHTTLAEATRKRRAKAMASLWDEVEAAFGKTDKPAKSKPADVGDTNPKTETAKADTSSTYTYKSPKKKGPLWLRATKKVVGGIAKVAWRVAKR